MNHENKHHDTCSSSLHFLLNVQALCLTQWALLANGHDQTYGFAYAAGLNVAECAKVQSLAT